MDEEIDTLVIGVRADVAGFARDVAAMKANLDGPLADGIARAGGALEAMLVRAATTGKLSFEDLRRVALAVLADIARAAVRTGIDAVLGGGGGGAGGGMGGGSPFGAVGTLLGLPGRATGGPVSQGRGYIVGERGPELFVPHAAGRIGTADGGMARGAVHITVNVTGAGETPQRMARSGRQVARAVRAALVRAEA